MTRTPAPLHLGALLVVLSLVPLTQIAAHAQADSAVAATAPITPQSIAINYRERPRFPYDPQRLKMRPKLDGTIGENEWSPLYTVTSGPITGTIFQNWDDEYLYFAARLDAPGWVCINVDGNGDGWLRGTDNLEVCIGPPDAEGTPKVIARVLDASSGRDIPVWNDKVVDPKQIGLAVRTEGGSHVVEIALPKGIAGVNPRRNAALGLRVDLLPATAVPQATAPYEPHLLLDVTLVEAKSVGTTGITPRLVVPDTQVVPGQNFGATLELSNQLEADRPIRNVTWEGVGPAADVLRLVRDVAVPVLKGLKNLSLQYKAPIPMGTIPGFYQMAVTVKFDDGSTVSSNATFTVVEAVAVQFTSGLESITVLGPTPHTVYVDVENRWPGFMRGDIEIEVPQTWMVKGRAKKTYNIRNEDGKSRERFDIVIPSNTPPGEYTLHATVTWRNQTWKARQTLRVLRSDAPAPAAAP